MGPCWEAQASNSFTPTPPGSQPSPARLQADATPEYPGACRTALWGGKGWVSTGFTA